jgi:hypothetical protein
MPFFYLSCSIRTVSQTAEQVLNGEWLFSASKLVQCPVAEEKELIQIQYYAHRMRVGLGHRVLPAAARPGVTLLHINLTSFYHSSGMSTFSQDIFPGVHAGAAKLSCFYFICCDLVSRT